MYRSMSVSRLFRLGLVLALLLVAVSVTGAQEPKILTTGLGMVGGDLPTVDPGLAETSSSIEVINQIFVGLTAQDVTTGDPQLGLAESMEVSEDGLTFTFNLMQNVPWVRYNAETGAVEQLMDESGNPRMVTAQDVVDGMLRSLSPETASPYSYVLVPYIVGAAEYNEGSGAMEDVQLTATDDFTVQITAPEAVSFAPSIYGLWMARAVPQWVIDEFGDVWTEPENIATNGPFALKEWAHEESLTIVKNPFWPGTEAIPQPILDEVTFVFLDPQQQFAEYLAGNLDASSVPLEEIERARTEFASEFYTGTNPCTYYLGFDNTEEPMTNANLRRAFSRAIDRQSLVDNVTKGGQIPAQWFSRPGLAAAPTLETNADLGIQYDPEAAQADLAAALEELGLADVSGLPQLTLSYNDSSGHAAIAQAIQQMWTDTLGIQVQLVALEPSTYFGTLSEDAPIIYRSGWCQDYSDANNFLYDVFYSKSSQNDVGFADATYDALVDEARLLTDVEQRRELYAQAEQILVVDYAAVAPIYWYTTNQLIKSNVEEAVSVTGNQAYYLWDKN